VDRRVLAERFFRGIWGGDPSVVDELAAADVRISYPIFGRLYGTPVVRGRDAVRRLVTGFAEQWANPVITIDETVSDGESVVLVWTFRARNVGEGSESSRGEEHGWGGITLFRFDEGGKIVEEIGEESDPGPARRTRSADPDAPGLHP